MSEIRSVVTTPAALGECPLWSESEQVLYWLDIDGMVVHRFDPTTGADEVRTVPARPGSIALTATAGQLLIAIEHQLKWFQWESGTLTPFRDLSDPTPDRLNDGRAPTLPADS